MSSPALAPEQLKRSKSYTRFMLGILELQALGVMGAAYYFQSGHRSDVFAFRLWSVTGDYYVAMLLYSAIFFGAITLFTYVTTIAKYFIDRRFGLNKARLGLWLVSVSKVLWLRFLAGLIAAATMLISAMFLGYSWWIPAAILATIYVYFLFTWYSPAMLAAFGLEVPFPPGALRDRLESLCRRAGIPVREIYEWQIGDRSTMGNAMVAGIGRGRRILVSDTLCKLCTDDEVEAILAHELGHEANKDLRWRALYRVATQVFICWLISKGEQYFFNVSPVLFANLPGIWLAYSALTIYAQFGLAARSRRQEKAADLYGWKLMGTSTTFISGLRKLTAANLVHVRKGSKRFGHPSLEDRMAEADRFEASLRAAYPPPPPPPPLSSVTAQ